MADRRWGAAIETFSRAAKVAPEDPEILLQRGTCFLESGDAAGALADAEAALNLDAASAELYLLQGRSLLAVQRFQDAMVAFSRAQALDPDRAETYTDRATALEGLGKRDLAELDRQLAALTAELESGSDPVASRLERAGLFFALDLNASAAHDLDLILGQDPSNGPAQLAMARLLFATGKEGEALALWKELAARPDADVAAAALIEMAGIYLDKGASAQALELLEGAEEGKRTPLLKARLAWILATSPDESVRDGERALRLAGEALASAPADDADILAAYAAAQAETGDLEGAIDMQQLALAADTEAPGPDVVPALRAYMNHKPYRMP